ncbi:MAG: PAS domain S-box protein [Anaerolineae bacterium]|nr:PAS domain S-box protein [Anaerolineae bacterium]
MKNSEQNQDIEKQSMDTFASHLTTSNMRAALIRVLLSTLIVMTAQEILKKWLFPHIEVWQSQLITVLFSGAVATGAAYFALRQMRTFYFWGAAAALQTTHKALKQQVTARTEELAQSNQRLEREIEDRKQAETDLRRERDFAESLLQTAQAIILVLDPQGRIVRINPYMEKLSGYQLAEIEGKDWFTTFLPEHDRERIWAVFLEAVEHIGSHRLVSAILTKDGVTRHIEWHTKTLQDLQGNIHGILSIGQDITERLRAEEALRATHDELERRVEERTREQQEVQEALERRVAQLAILNDVGSKIAAILDLNLIFNRVTRLVQERFGYHHVGLFTLEKEQKLLIMRAKSGIFAHLYPPYHVLKPGQGMVGWVGIYGKTLLANDVDAEPQYVNLYPDVIPTQSELSVPIRVAGEIMGVLDVQSPQPNAFDEEDVMVIETLADQVAVAIANARLYQTVQRELAERKQAEAALRESEVRYHTVSDLISDVAYAIKLTSDGKIEAEWVTGAFTRISGLELNEIPSLLDWRKLIHPDDHSIMHQAIKHLKASLPYENDFRFLSKDGEVRWLHTRNHPVWDEIQQRVVRVIGALQDITERKQMEQMMLRSERLAAMGYITATLAHEIKNPLQAIQSNLELILDFPLEPDEQQESLYVCNNEVQRLIEITQSVLSLAQTRKDKYHEVSIIEQVQRTLDLLHQALKKAEVDVSTELPPHLPCIKGDSDQVGQIFLNLVINSIEAMPNGGNLYIDAYADEGIVNLSFMNNGPPIPAYQLEHIFEPFFTTKPQGVGLGLFISHQIAQQHGGTLTVTNLEDNEGVVFTLTLPAHASINEQESSL